MEPRTESNAAPAAATNGQEPGLSIRPIWKDYGRKGVRYLKVTPGQDMGRLVSAEDAIRIRPELFEEGAHVAKVDDSGRSPCFYDFWGNEMTANEAMRASPELFDSQGRLRVVGLDETDLDVLEVVTQATAGGIKAAHVRELLGLERSAFDRAVRRLQRAGRVEKGERHGYWRVPATDRQAVAASAETATGSVLAPAASVTPADRGVVTSDLDGFGAIREMVGRLALASPQAGPDSPGVGSASSLDPAGFAVDALDQAREHARELSGLLAALDGQQDLVAALAAQRDAGRLWLEISRAELELDVILEGREPTES